MEVIALAVVAARAVAPLVYQLLKIWQKQKGF